MAQFGLLLPDFTFYTSNQICYTADRSKNICPVEVCCARCNQGVRLKLLDNLFCFALLPPLWISFCKSFYGRLRWYEGTIDDYDKKLMSHHVTVIHSYDSGSRLQWLWIAHGQRRCNRHRFSHIVSPLLRYLMLTSILLNNTVATVQRTYCPSQIRILSSTTTPTRVGTYWPRKLSGKLAYSDTSILYI